MTSISAISSPVSPVSTSIFDLIHELHATITRSIDTSLSWEQLNSPPINYTLVRPIVDRFAPRPHAAKSTAVKSDTLAVPVAGEGGESGTTKVQTSMDEVVPLGGILYALMVNRFVLALLYQLACERGKALKYILGQGTVHQPRSE